MFLSRMLGNFVDECFRIAVLPLWMFIQDVMCFSQPLLQDQSFIINLNTSSFRFVFEIEDSRIPDHALIILLTLSHALSQSNITSTTTVRDVELLAFRSQIVLILPSEPSHLFKLAVPHAWTCASWGPIQKLLELRICSSEAQICD